MAQFGAPGEARVLLTEARYIKNSLYIFSNPTVVVRGGVFTVALGPVKKMQLGISQNGNNPVCMELVVSVGGKQHDSFVLACS